MRTTVDIDKELLERAKALTKIRTNKELINISLKELIRRKYLQRLRNKIGNFEIDLDLKELEKIREDE